ncbi:hypothetical protein F0562_014839 [Nyssa sinensis]|uniref:Uncharacterized protein n=1 Tax=Nyssa sinensis TaxID=561372 RepID=A0A5J4ZNW7_9ASTE|nr:hypothetical protein F0562_014839 [Nyssa sinensis]
MMASTLLASTAIMLSSLIAVLMTNGSGKRSTGFVYGDESQLGFSILVCFLVAFLFDVQSIRYYSYASILINVPVKKMSQRSNHHLTAEYVGTTVNRGSYFCSLVKYVNPITKLCIIRASREEYKKVWSAITLARSVGNHPVLFNLLDLSWSIKAYKNAALKCDEWKFEQYKLVAGACLTDDVNQHMQNYLEKIKILEY